MYVCDTEELKKELALKGIYKTKQLSEITGINRNTLGAVLNGSAKPSSRVMTKIVEAANIEPEKAGRIFFNTNLRNT